MIASDPVLIARRLRKQYDLSAHAGDFLHFGNPYEILIATILSAQTTDKTVNIVTRELFARYPDVSDLASADIADVEKIIHKTGFYHAKARNIIATSQTVVRQFKGVVPDRMADLVILPGVGRKTANIVLHHAFGITEGIAVDTHVRRVSIRLGLTDKTEPPEIEEDLMRIFPHEIWGEINGLFILHGRQVCSARKPACESCILSDLCRYAEEKD